MSARTPHDDDDLDEDGLTEHLAFFSLLLIVCMLIAAGVLIAAALGVIP